MVEFDSWRNRAAHGKRRASQVYCDVIPPRHSRAREEKGNSPFTYRLYARCLYSSDCEVGVGNKSSLLANSDLKTRFFPDGAVLSHVVPVAAGKDQIHISLSLFSFPDQLSNCFIVDENTVLGVLDRSAFNHSLGAGVNRCKAL